MNGLPVSCEEDLLAMRSFVQEALDTNCMIQYLGMDGYSAPPDAGLPGYVTCKQLRTSFSILPGPGMNGGSGGGAQAGSGGGASGGGAAAGSGSGISTHGIPMDIINRMVRTIYNNNEKVLKNCAFIADYFGFQRCIMSLTNVYDLREFFGGMAAYHDGQRMASVLGINTPFRFASDFVSGCNGQVSSAFLAVYRPA